MKKVLIITYYWPPSGGSGVQRWLKYVKYLRDFGIEPIVLTVDPLDAVYPNIDPSLKKDLLADIEIHYARAKSPLSLYEKIRKKPVPKSGFAGEKKPNILDSFFRFIRGNFYLPDARKGWNKSAYSVAKNIITTHDIDTIITSSPPHSTQLVGLKLKQELAVKWICDLRDPWTELFYNKDLYQTSIAKRIDKKYEKNCLESANELIVVSKTISNQFIKSYPITASKMNIIPNGYDPADFKNVKEIITDYKYISYIGSLGEIYPIDKMIKAFKDLCLIEPNWKLRFVGNIPESTISMIKNNKLESSVEIGSYKPHHEAIELMVSSDILLLIIPKLKKNKGILTGKLFEYIASGTPIILIGPPDGDAATILSEFKNVKIFNYSADIDLIQLTKEIDQQKSDSLLKNKYSRVEQAEKIAELIKRL